MPIRAIFVRPEDICLMIMIILVVTIIYYSYYANENRRPVHSITLQTANLSLFTFDNCISTHGMIIYNTFIIYNNFLFVMKTMALVSYILIYITGLIWINKRVINSYKYTSLYRSSFVCTKVNIIPFLVSYDVNHTSSTNVNGRIREVIMCYLHRRVTVILTVVIVNIRRLLS